MYHPTNNPTELPVLTKAEDVRNLPWGGNAWWDCPIMLHIEKFIKDPNFPVEERKKAAELGGFLMTGEGCGFTPDYTFEMYLEQIAEGSLV